MPGKVSLDGVEFGDATLQSVMNAIDREEIPFDPSDALEGLSILDDSFIDKIEVGLCQTQSWNNSKSNLSIAPLLDSSLPTISSYDHEMWQALLLEQKNRYEEQINKLIEELAKIKRRSDENENGKEKEKKNTEPKVERERWLRIHKTLDNYFAEYNVQF